MNKQKIIYIVLLAVLLIVFGFSAFYVASYFLEGQEQQAQFDELAALVESIQTQKNDGSGSTGSGLVDSAVADDSFSTGSANLDENGNPVMLPEYEALYKLNPDLVGWIRIENTIINYPVMQTPDYVDYYLKKDFNGKYSSRGCIYVREVCDVFEPSDNLTIYGHRMRDGSMFASLHKFTVKSFWETNNLITFDTLYEYHTYQIFAVFKTSATLNQGFSYHLFVDADDEAEFDEFIATCKELALYDTGITPVYGDKIICLSTCDYTYDNGRLVVAAVRIQ